MELGFGVEIKQQQQLALTPSMVQSLAVLKMNAQDLSEMVREALDANPLLESDGEYFSLPFCGEGKGFQEAMTRAGETTLRDELMLALHVSVKREWAVKMGEYIIDSLDENGYLPESTASIAKRFGVGEERVKALLKKLQTFEPAGIFARSLRECLYLQLKRLPVQNECAKEIVKRHLSLVAEKKYSEIAELSGYSASKVKEACELIRKLDPRPGRSLSVEETRYTVPEISVEAIDGKLKVDIINRLPQVRISESSAEYRTATRGTSGEKYVKDELASARNIISSVEQRYSTLLRIARSVAARQQEFFLKKGEMRALTLSQVAEELNINVSTVSRAISEKALLFDGKVYDIAAFFPSRLKDGGSSSRVKRMMAELIAKEDRQNPTADSELARIISQTGAQVSRRTIAKYRGQEKIPSAAERKKKYSV